MSSSIYLTFKDPIPEKDWESFCDQNGIDPLNEGDKSLLTKDWVEIWVTTNPHPESRITQVSLSIGFMDQTRPKTAALLAFQLMAQWPVQTLGCSPEFETLLTPTNPQLTPALREQLNKNAATIGGSWIPFKK